MAVSPSERVTTRPRTTTRGGEKVGPAKKVVVPTPPEGMPPRIEGLVPLSYGNEVFIYLKEGDRKTREKLAEIARKFLDIYVESGEQ